ncbi:hypothetical protein MMC21_006602, partial [Puttea exsequens]|nr:hypothetical protein [Puttea exsequens]
PKITQMQGDIVGQMNMAWMILYGLSIGFSKIAILLLYIRVFTTQKRAFTATAVLVGFVVIATALANTFAVIFQCHPQAYAWDKTIAGGSCMNGFENAQYMAIPNVVTGAVMLAMPMPVIWNLNIDASAKVALTATFLHGIIGFIASCARLVILFSTHLDNFSQHTALIWTIWTLNEPANYIIAACLPTLRPIFVRILPSSFFILSRKRSTPSPQGSSTLKVSWPKGSYRPRIEYSKPGFQTSSLITGPWDAQRGEEIREGEVEREGMAWVDLEGGLPANCRRVSGTGESVAESEGKGVALERAEGGSEDDVLR